MVNLVKVLKYFYDVPKKRNFLTKDQDMSYRNDWLSNRITKFYTEQEFAQVKTNRRSDGSDEAVIAHFMTAEQPYHPIPKDEHFDNAVQWVTEQFRPNRTLHPVSFPDLRYYPSTLNVSAEAPWTNDGFSFRPENRNVDAESELPKLDDSEQEISWIRGIWNRIQKVTPNFYMRTRQALGLAPDNKLTYHNLYNQIFLYNRKLVHKIGIGASQFWNGNIVKPYYWLTLHMRLHVVGQFDADKVRAVFGATKLLLQTELMFIWPLQASYLNTSAGRMLWGREIIKGGWRKLFTEMYEYGQPGTFISTDWSQFDNRLLHELIRIVHTIWRSYFDFSQYEGTSFYPNSRPMNSKKLDRIWLWMTESILSTPILLPNGELWTWKYNGFGSGFQQTQLLDSFCNAIMILTCLSALGVNINHPDFWARFQGDDSFIKFFELMYQIYGPHFLIMLSEAAKHYFNAKLSAEKSQISDRLSGMSVLSYFNHYGMPYRTEEDLLRHLFFPEHFQSLEGLAASALGLAYANCGHHERFHRLCEYIYFKLTREKGLQPKFKSIEWMIRSELFPSLREMVDSGFPDRIKLLGMVSSPQGRTIEQKARQWPTESHPKGGFFFTSDV